MLRFLILCLICLCGCKQAPEKKGLKIAFSSHPQTIDPRKSADFLSSTLVCLAYEGLTRCSIDGGVEPGLAESWTVSPDGLVYTFTLRKSFWTDGKPVTAFDFEKSWKNILDPTFAAPCAYLLFPIKNGESGTNVGIQAIDDQTLVVTLERKTPYFLSLTAFPLFLPAPDEIGKVFNGPFRIEKDQSNEIVLVKNGSYWKANAIQLDAISIQIIRDENTALELFEKGEIDWVGSPFVPLPSDCLPFFKERLRYIPMAASTILTFNSQTFPFNNPKIRKAFALCLDTEEILSKIAPAGQIAPSRILPPSLFKEPMPPLFEEKEKTMTELPDLGKITLWIRPNPVEKRVALAMQNRWRQALGVNVEIEELDPKIHMQRLHAKDYQIAIASWISQFFDPVNILDRYRLKTNQKNYAGWENKEYQKLLEQAANQSDEKKRLEILAEAESLLASEFVVFPLFHWASPTLASDRVKNIATTPCGGVLFEKFTIEQ